MRKWFIALVVSSLLMGMQTRAQIEIPRLDIKNININDLLGKVLQVKKGWAPQFFSGRNKIPKLHVVSRILNTKKDLRITRLFNTFKTGRTVYRITNYAGSAIALYGVIKKISANKDSVATDAKNLFISGLSSMSVGTVVKLLTKGASYKAVDLFGGVIKKKLMDIISFDAMPAQNYLGRTGFKASMIIKL